MQFCAVAVGQDNLSASGRNGKLTTTAWADDSSGQGDYVETEGLHRRRLVFTCPVSSAQKINVPWACAARIRGIKPSQTECHAGTSLSAASAYCPAAFRSGVVRFKFNRETHQQFGFFPCRLQRAFVGPNPTGVLITSGLSVTQEKSKNSPELFTACFITS